jgi:hypothetical protein
MVGGIRTIYPSVLTNHVNHPPFPWPKAGNGTEFGAAGRRWGERVAGKWEATVRYSFESIKAEAGWQ